MKSLRRLAAASLLVLSGALHAEVVVIVHRNNPVASMTADQVAQIYMGASTTFPGGGAATPVDQPEGNPTRDEFLAKVLEKTPAQFKAVWSRLIFSGKGTRPKALPGSAEVRGAVAADPAAIGFVDRASVDGSVKAVLSVK
jgi:ABC-type phosphate transport system substrate-binding protein